MRETSLKVNGPEARRRRQLMGLEIADVAARVGISRSFLSRIEVHSAPVTPTTYKALRTALRCDNEDAEALLVPAPNEPEEETWRTPLPKPSPTPAPPPSKSNAS